MKKKNFTIKDSLSRSGNACTRSESSLITWLARGSFQVNSEIDTALTPENKCWYSCEVFFLSLPFSALIFFSILFEVRGLFPFVFTAPILCKLQTVLSQFRTNADIQLISPGIYIKKLSKRMRCQIKIKPYSRMVSYSNTQIKTLCDTKITTLN